MWMWRKFCPIIGNLIYMGIKILAHIILVILLVVLFPIITTWYVYVALNLLIRELIRGYKNKQKNNPTK